MAKHYFNILDISLVLFSLVTFVLDLTTDIVVCIGLLLDGHTVWGGLMVVFIAVPAVLMSAFSLAWHIHDKTVTSIIVVSHLLLLAPVERYIKVALFGLKARRTQKAIFAQKALRAQSDASLLRLIGAFLESAPQLLLQLYILFCNESGNWVTGLSTGCSLLSLTWTMTAYCDSQCQTNSISYCHHLLGLIVHWTWQLFMTTARIAAFVFFACAVHIWLFAVMGGHWLTTFVWISVRGTDFGTGYKKLLFRIACAFIYIFVFLNLNDGKSRWRITAYYLLVLLENTGMLVVFLVMGNDNMILVSCLVVYAGFFIGVICMLVYYYFLHHSGPGKRYFQPRLSASNISRTSQEADSHIFNIESPRPLTLIEGAAFHLSLSGSSSQNPVANSEQKSHLDGLPGSSQQASKAISSSKHALQMAWQSGMESSSGSSSSLASTKNSSSLIKRTSSMKSDNSHGSGSSDNQLLPQQIARNSMSKSLRKSFTTELAHLDYLKQVQPRESDNVIEPIEESQSPTLSKDSWATLSDQAMQLYVLRDFTVLGIDESSSTDKRVSDSSSFSNQQSLSPLDVSLLLKNSHARLKSTISATIAAATCNQSSDESTPSKSKCFPSYSSVVSAQDDSLNSAHIESVSHNTAFMEFSSCSQEQLSTSQVSSKGSSQHREALSTLPDIIETFDHDELSDFESRENSYEKLAGEAMKSKMNAESLRECSSTYPLDSTLTVSKLEIKKPRSYLASQKRGDIDCHGTFSSEHRYTTAVEAYRPSAEYLLSTPTLDIKGAYKGDSPFTDQELVTVMTKSLQNYIDGTSSVKSNNPEREGLALTLEDLRISRESTPESNPLTYKAGDCWKTRSASSLFHDSTLSSPPSSASKMNCTKSMLNAEIKLSPNAFKQIDETPQRLHSLDMLQKTKDQAIATIQHSHALKFIMDSYASTALKSPHTATPTSKKLFTRTPADTVSSKPMIENQSLSCGKRKILDFSSTSRSIGQNIIQRRSIGSYPYSVNAHAKESLNTTARKRSFHASHDREVSEKVKDSDVHGGISSTKKLIVHSAGLSMPKYKPSSSNMHTLEEKGSDSGSEKGGYVSGQYCPPLCASDLEVNSFQLNLDCERKNLNKISKPISELSSKEKKQNMTSADLHLLDPLKKVITKRDLECEKQPSNFFSQTHLNPKFHVCKSYPCAKCPSSPYHYDSMNKALHKSDHSKQKVLENQSHNVNRMTEDELLLSANHVAEYFSEALESNFSSSNCGSDKKYSQPLLQAHSSRQPLQRLENSQHLLLGANNYGTNNGLSLNNDPRNDTQNSRHHATHNYAISPEVHIYRSDNEHSGQHLRQFSKDLPKAKQRTEFSDFRNLTSRPPLSDSRKQATSKSDKSGVKVRFSVDGDEKYYQQNYHIKDKPSG